MKLEVHAQLASSFARLALHNVRQEYPSKLDHVMNDASEVCAPRVLHPAFYGSYDWHSSVHMHWTLAHLLRRFPGLPEGEAIKSLFEENLNPANIAAELAYLGQASRQSFERTYGWAWLLKLHAELVTLATHDRSASTWSSAVQPLAQAFVTRFLRFLPLAGYPIRAGTHANSAFAMLFALDYADIVGHPQLAFCIREKALQWFAPDRSYPARYEPSGDDFLSGGLLEAALMCRVLDKGFPEWWRGFCQEESDLEVWRHPVSVSDRTDPKLAHLDGLNLSRAWCWTRLLPHLPSRLGAGATAAIDAHLAAALPHVVGGDYAGAHWLASFALLALSGE